MGRNKPLLRLGLSGVVGVELVLNGRGMKWPSLSFGGGLGVECIGAVVSFIIIVGGSVSVAVVAVVILFAINVCKVSTVLSLMKNVDNVGDKILMSIGFCKPVLLTKWWANGMSMSLLSLNKSCIVCGGSEYLLLINWKWFASSCRNLKELVGNCSHRDVSDFSALIKSS